MLNKEEKHIIKDYILDGLKKIEEISLNYEEMEKYIITENKYNFITSKLEDVTEPKPYLAFSDILEITLNIQSWINSIIEKKYVKEITIEEKINKSEKQRIKEREKIKEIKEKARKEGIQIGEKQLKDSFEELKDKIERKGFEEGYQLAKKHHTLSEKEILNKADFIKAQKEIMKDVQK